MGIVVISLVAAVVVGFVGALVYTSSENSKLTAADPADQARAETTVPDKGAVADGPTTSKPPEVLGPDALAKKVAPSVWTVSSLDDAGRPVEGSAFVAGSSGGQTFLLTSLTVVRAATRIPGPDVVVRNGGSEVKATLWTWQDDRDLALLVIGRTAPALPWAGDGSPAKAGDKVYVVTGAGGPPLAGVLGTISATSVQHNIFVDTARQGAPLLNEKGEVLGMASSTFNNPGGATPDIKVFSAVPVRAACDRVLSCGSGNISVSASSTVPPNGAPTTKP
ncbi:MAG: serine protease [Actinobacteria bacterium]|nr:serine protease [Actinomycetota bacterium]